MVQQTGEQSARSKYPRSLSMTSSGGWNSGEAPSGLEALEMGSCVPSSPKRRTSCSWRKLPVGACGSSVSDEACGQFNCQHAPGTRTDVKTNMKLSAVGKGGGEGGQLRRNLHATSMLRTRCSDNHPHAAVEIVARSERR